MAPMLEPKKQPGREDQVVRRKSTARLLEGAEAAGVLIETAVLLDNLVTVKSASTSTIVALIALVVIAIAIADIDSDTFLLVAPLRSVGTRGSADSDRQSG